MQWRHCKQYRIKNVYCWRSNLLEQFLQSAVRKGFRHESACYGLQCVSFRWVIDLLCTCVILSRWCETRYPGNLVLIVLRSCWRQTLKGNRRKTLQTDCKCSHKLCNSYGCKSVYCWVYKDVISRHTSFPICGETNNSPRNNLYWGSYTRLLRLKPSFNRPLSSTIIAFFLFNFAWKEWTFVPGQRGWRLRCIEIIGGLRRCVTSKV